MGLPSNQPTTHTSLWQYFIILQRALEIANWEEGLLPRVCLHKPSPQDRWEFPLLPSA